MDPKILELYRNDPRFACEAYEFVCDSVTYTQDRLGRKELKTREGNERDEDRHVDGGELLRGACEFAIKQFGMMAPMVFQQWGIHTTGDFGDMVFLLIDSEKLSRSDRDDPNDFRDVFDLPHALTEGYQLTADAYPSRKTER